MLLSTEVQDLSLLVSSALWSTLLLVILGIYKLSLNVPNTNKRIYFSTLKQMK
jgi:hypothetical protein